MQSQIFTAIYTVLILVSPALLISGCGGDFSYKRGAGMSVLEKERETCADQNKEENEIKTCLENSGWVIVGADKPLLEEQSLVEEQPDKIVTPDGRTVTVDITPVEITANPLDKINISSWWKAGAGPDKLMSDGDSCVFELGDEYTPEADLSVVATGFHKCMKDKDWFALEAK
ncbi:MAG: hypothetical protein V7742_05465 [Halioglobus sp.]